MCRKPFLCGEWVVAGYLGNHTGSLPIFSILTLILNVFKRPAWLNVKLGRRRSRESVTYPVPGRQNRCHKKAAKVTVSPINVILELPATQSWSVQGVKSFILPGEKAALASLQYEMPELTNNTITSQIFPGKIDSKFITKSNHKCSVSMARQLISKQRGCERGKRPFNFPILISAFSLIGTQEFYVVAHATWDILHIELLKLCHFWAGEMLRG